MRTKSLPYEIRRVMAGTSAMAQSPSEAEELAQIFGVDTCLAQARQARDNTPHVSYLYLVDTHIPVGQDAWNTWAGEAPTAADFAFEAPLEPASI